MPEKKSYDIYTRKYTFRLIYIILSLGFLLSVLFLLLKILNKDTGFFTIVFCGSIVFPLGIFLVRKFANPLIGSYIILAYSMLTLMTGLVLGGKTNIVFLLPTAFPAMTFYFFGRRRGLLWIGIFLLFYVLLTLLVMTGAFAPLYPHSSLGMGLLAFLITTLLTYFSAHRHEMIEELMENQFYLDPLTKLPNRARLLKDLESAASPVILLINIDDFKGLNEIFGHNTGDEVLLFLHRKLRLLVTNPQIKTYKLSGDEFALLLLGGSRNFSTELITSIARLLTSKINHDNFTHSNQTFRIRITIGIASSELVGRERLLSYADIALKTAKHNKENYFYYQKAENTRANHQTNLRRLNNLSYALTHDGIVPFFQPIVNNITGVTEKYECLLRVKDKEGIFHSPAHYLELAKKIRLYSHITQEMLNKSIAAFCSLEKEFSINLSVEDLLNPEIYRLIFTLLETNPPIRNRICFELLESEGVENYSKVSSFIRRVKLYGGKIAIDDFGSGYSNFDYLIRLDIDYIKLDGSLVKNLDRDRNSEIIVKNIVNFSREMGKKTIAEFVHSREIQAKVMELGIEYSQGYYLGQPAQVPKENF